MRRVIMSKARRARQSLVEPMERRVLLSTAVPLADATLYEAELASVTGDGIMTTHSGYTGTGYVDILHDSGDSVEFTVETAAAGTYELGFRYANAGAAARTMSLYVNGEEIPGGAAFGRTAAWTTWDVLPVTVALGAGANKVRVQANGQSGPNLDSMSVRAVAPQPAVTYEAEAATLSGAKLATDHAGYTGTGFADYQHRRSDFVEFAIEAPAAGTYALDFRYANGGTYDRPLDVAVNGEVAPTRLSFVPTGAWGKWGTVRKTVTLPAGPATVRLTATMASGPNLDALVVSPAVTPPPVVEPVTLQAEAAALAGPITASTNGGYTGSGYADFQHGPGESIEFTYNAPRVGDYVLGFRYANGGSADRPLELKVNGTVALARMSFSATGGWSTWQVLGPTFALPAGVNTIRLTSIGTNGPNLDALTIGLAPGPVTAR